MRSDTREAREFWRGRGCHRFCADKVLIIFKLEQPQGGGMLICGGFKDDIRFTLGSAPSGALCWKNLDPPSHSVNPEIPCGGV